MKSCWGNVSALITIAVGWLREVQGCAVSENFSLSLIIIKGLERSEVPTAETMKSIVFRCYIHIITNVSEECATSIVRADGGSTFLRNVGNHLPNHTASHPRIK
jgi:hypothetical protein